MLGWQPFHLEQNEEYSRSRACEGNLVASQGRVAGLFIRSQSSKVRCRRSTVCLSWKRNIYKKQLEFSLFCFSLWKFLTNANHFCPRRDQWQHHNIHQDLGRAFGWLWQPTAAWAGRWVRLQLRPGKIQGKSTLGRNHTLSEIQIVPERTTWPGFWVEYLAIFCPVLFSRFVGLEGSGFLITLLKTSCLPENLTLVLVP